MNAYLVCSSGHDAHRDERAFFVILQNWPRQENFMAGIIFVNSDIRRIVAFGSIVGIGCNSGRETHDLKCLDRSGQGVNTKDT